MAVMARMHQGQKKGGAKRGWESFRGDQGAYTGFLAERRIHLARIYV